MCDFDFSALARLNTVAVDCSANIRANPSHFQVDEQLPFEPYGEGGHVLLKIRKRGANTDWLASQLAEFAQVPKLDVGYAGLKDRHAITTQWFSVKVEGAEEPNWTDFDNDDVQVIEIGRHKKKLKRGVLSGNHFKLRLTTVTGDRTLWEHQLEHISQYGVPNYFAEQRFGRQGNNLHKAQQWFSEGKKPKKRQQKSLILSAARSWLFNLVLAQRVQLGNWDQLLQGDVMLLSGTKASLFNTELDDSALNQRLQAMDIHPTGPLWGRGALRSQDDCAILERSVLSESLDWCEGLERQGLTQARRSLRLYPASFEWQWVEHDLELQFYLPAGCYATAVLRELAMVTDIS